MRLRDATQNVTCDIMVQTKALSEANNASTTPCNISLFFALILANPCTNTVVPNSNYAGGLDGNYTQVLTVVCDLGHEDNTNKQQQYNTHCLSDGTWGPVYPCIRE